MQVFFSLDLVGKKASTFEIRRAKQILLNRGLKSTIVIGSYKGETERSFKVDVSAENIPAIVRVLCQKFNQESFLVVDNNGQAKLHFVASGMVETIGRFEEVGAEVAKRLDAWTYVPHTNTFYAVKGA